MSMLNVYNIAGSALSAQSMRLNAVASNLANADSVAGPDGQPYRAKQVVFAATSVEGGAKLEGAAMGVRVTGVVEDLAPPRIIFDPKNPAANEQGFVTMPNVNVVEEMVNMISASRAYQSNVEVMNTAKTLMQKTLALGQ
ncbi:MAG: flagellar basal body rod protein FlgC [Rhodocyclaceae bacterium]|jgi:flagellar basal-body rod protein FlgC|nr:flagellar basal body rod protein FlgC [Rhodocyclaceae bacterium]MCO5097967.1 flagellar basal body rod protein FlgC [Rhodocyclaceae bacterium]